ncbi:hypothetical protein [Lysinibacillus fusiformis]|uniref:hypothetical protein n=1 Tax=Lysinibacillus fusiformis TaxID=28031 RepID=UPI003556CFC2
MPNYVLPNPKDFNKVWYVSPDGDDSTGDGSKMAPYNSHIKAIQMAASGDGIFIQAGVYEAPHLVLDTYYRSVCFYDYNKKLAIWGENENTVINFDGTKGIRRDANLFEIPNAGTVISNMKINFIPGKSVSYSNAIFRWCNGNFRNLFIENKGTIKWSTCYYNDQLVAGPKATNCIFKCNGRYTSNYSGKGVWLNCVFDYSHGGGTFTNSLQRTITENDSVLKSLPVNLIDTGSPTILDPDNTRSNIGVCGGPYGWGFIALMYKSFIYLNGEYLKLTNCKWESVSDEPPNEILFKSEGMDGHHLLNRLSTVSDVIMLDRVSSVSDKLFNTKINLKKYYHLTDLGLM